MSQTKNTVCNENKDEKEGNKMSLKQLAQAGDLDIDFGLGEEDVFLMAGATTDQT